MTVPTLPTSGEAAWAPQIPAKELSRSAAIMAAYIRSCFQKNSTSEICLKRGTVQSGRKLSAVVEGLLIEGNKQQYLGDLTMAQATAVQGVWQIIEENQLLETLNELQKLRTMLPDAAPIALTVIPKKATPKGHVPQKFLQLRAELEAIDELRMVQWGDTFLACKNQNGDEWAEITFPGQNRSWVDIAIELVTAYLVSPVNWISDQVTLKPIVQQPTRSQQSPTRSATASQPDGASKAQITKIHNPDQEGLFLLHHAAIAGDTKEAESLLKKGAATEVKDRNGNTPLHLAIKHEQLEMAHLLISYRANPNHRNYLFNTPLHLAAEVKSAPLISALIDLGADTEIANHRGMTALHVAVRIGCQPCVKALIAANANIEAAMDQGVRPLHLAGWFGHVALVAFLVEQSAELDATDGDGNTALHFAAYNSQVKTIKNLINMGANMQIRNRSGASYLHGVSQGYQQEIFNFMEKE